jgi:hypothetical protein
MSLKVHITLIIAILALILAVTGCDRRKVDVPTEPYQVSSDDAKRVLAFQYDSAAKTSGYYYITMFDTADKGKDINDEYVQIVLGDSLIDLEYTNIPLDPPHWYALSSHQIVGVTEMELYINGTRVLSTTVKPVGLANAAFPSDYIYQQPLTLNWAVSSTNEYQFVRAESWNNGVDGPNSPFSSYVRRVSNTAASFTFPANCVSLAAGDSLQTSFYLCVEEVNYKIINDNAVMVFQEEGQGYYAGLRYGSKAAFWARARDLYKAVSKSAY